METTIQTHNKRKELPLGKITARGWIREQLLRSKHGMGGHLDELEPQMIRDPYLNGKTDEGWGAHKAGWGAEISGNYWFGLIQLAFTLDDEELKCKAEEWVNGVLANQRPDGYLGTYTESDDFYDDYNAWGTSCGMRALLAYYHATGREDVLDGVYQCMLWFCRNWAGDRKTRYCGCTIMDIMSICYSYKGDERLKTFVDEYADFLNRNDINMDSVNSLIEEELVYNSNHATNYAFLPKIMASSYMATGEERYYQAAVNCVKKAKDKIFLPNGGIASNTEYLCPICSVTETEFCTFSFFNHSLLSMGEMTKDPEYSDMVERIVFNGVQGARKKDEKAIAYFTSPNQIYATDKSDYYGYDMGVYAPCYPTACCPVTSIWAVPEYVRGMGLTDSENNIYISLYGPASLDFGDLMMEEETEYPFRDTIHFRITDSKVQGSRSIYFRIPEWCKKATFSINRETPVCVENPQSYYGVNRNWKQGDAISIQFEREIRISRLNDGDSYGHYPLVIEYGPLLFALPLPEEWSIIPGNPHTPLPDGWHWYNVSPVLLWDDRGDAYEQLSLRKFNISWNVALDEHLSPDSIKITENEHNEYVWDKPKLTLTVPGYKALFSYAPYIQKTHEVYQSPIDVQEELVLELVPYGCTNLRISCFPRAKLPVRKFPG